MNPHPYLRAYMAGILLPCWFLVLVLIGFMTYGIPSPLERVVMFPLVVVPNLWGVWNTLYRAMALKRWMPLGAWGALLPLILFPLALALERFLDLSIVTLREVLPLLPVAMGVYYLAWKHIVGFFNRVVEMP